MVEGNTSYDTYKDLVEMALDKYHIIRKILTEVPFLSSVDTKEYVKKSK